ncbi:MAG: protein phosphatase 2C domain-containing protein [Gammaproteobacteria bacterium]|nr:protein phosphatase 2C domain-containing protein [Gammaproteobacteria bacterium]NND39144.1 SpoIIE family protein phosphatase [Pseudomonadales bacterium]NNM11633.1 SpoIIE family protein phosphatase [Pseudomonadales bacterium]
MDDDFPNIRYITASVALQEKHVFLNGHCVLSTHRSPDKPTDNEDACLLLQLSESSGVIAIADGAGGHAAGRDASRIALEHVQRELLAADNATDLRAPILNAFEAANAQLLEEARGSATTLMIVELQGDTLRHYHVGDSSAMLVGQRGVLRLQTVAQSLVGYGIEAGLLHTDAALDHDERHVVLSLVGTSDMRVEIGAPLPLKRFDTLLLCSDGLTDNVGLLDIVELLRKGPIDKIIVALQEKATRNMALGNGHPDDLTLAIYRRCK